MRPSGPSRPANATTVSELIEELIFNPANRDSVFACVTAARENARQVREEITSDMWEQVNALFLRLKEARAEGTWLDRPHYVLAHGHRRRASVRRRHRRDDGPRRGLAAPAARPISRARERDSGAGGSALQERRARCLRITSTGSGCCARVRRSRATAAATPPICGPSASPSS